MGPKVVLKEVLRRALLLTQTWLGRRVKKVGKYPKENSESEIKLDDYLNNLDNLLSFGNALVTSKRVNQGKIRAKKILLFSMFGIVQRISDGILCLLRQSRIGSAEILLRTILETYINLRYIYAVNNQKNAIKFLLEDTYENIEYGNRMIDFIKHCEENDINIKGMLSDHNWQGFLDIKNDELVYLRKKYKRYGNKRLPDLRERASIVDREFKKQKGFYSSNSLEWWYLQLYPYFSDLIHANARGLNNLYEKDENGEYFIDITGEKKLNDGLIRISVTTYILYLDFLEIYVSQFGIKKPKDFANYKKIAKKYGTGTKSSKESISTA